MAKQTRTAVVTGGNRGIGKEVSYLLASIGYTVILTARSELAAKKAAATISTRMGKVIGARLDVTIPETIYNLEAFVISEFGTLDVLINNAGVSLDNSKTSPKNISVEDISPQVLIETLKVNLVGSLRLVQSFLPHMRKSGYGRIVNVSSSMGRFSKLNNEAPAYRISKSALNALTIVIASDLIGYNILVNAVCPGSTRTRMGPIDAIRTPTEAAKGIVWAATLPNGGPSGKFFRDMHLLSWL
jgi:NAD(P)-dependent dehydrogenase (short-subunit alcohol dehydrogenase family)